MEIFEVMVQLKYDNTVCCFDSDQVHKTITGDEFQDIPVFWVWKNKKNNKPVLSKCEGVLFIGESSKPPQMFFTDAVTETTHPPRRKIPFTIVHDQPTVEEPSHFRKRVS